MGFWTRVRLPSGPLMEMQHNNTITVWKAGDYMPNGLEITKAAIDDFQKIQAHMKNAKEENATKTYEGLKKDYKSLKAILQVSGVNLADIDEIKE